MRPDNWDEVADCEVCPKCGGEVTRGYGLMGGGIGEYVFCAGDECEFFAKKQDDPPATPKEGGTL